MMLFVLSADRRGADNQPQAMANWIQNIPSPSLACEPHAIPTEPVRGDEGGKKSRAWRRKKKKKAIYLHSAPVQPAVITSHSVWLSAHSELLAASEREFRQRDLFTWSRSLLLIGEAPRAVARSHLYGERSDRAGRTERRRQDRTGQEKTVVQLAIFLHDAHRSHFGVCECECQREREPLFPPITHVTTANLRVLVIMRIISCSLHDSETVGLKDSCQISDWFVCARLLSAHLWQHYKKTGNNSQCTNSQWNETVLYLKIT